MVYIYIYVYVYVFSVSTINAALTLPPSLPTYLPTLPTYIPYSNYIGILWMMYLNTSRETRNKGELSAYSLFNENVEAFVLLPSCLPFFFSLFTFFFFFFFFFFPFLFPCVRGGVLMECIYIFRIDGATTMEDLDRELRRQMY